MNAKKMLIGSVFASLVLAGCGGGGSVTSSSTTGYLVDSAVANADYDCVADGNFNKKTGPDGSFTCSNTSDVRFRIGHLVLGDIHGLPSDKYVFPQDLLGVGRDVHDAKVAAMAQLLQAVDNDGNPENGIAIAEETKDMVGTETHFNPADVSVYLDAASVNPEHIPTHADALAHLAQSEQAVAAANAGANAGQNAANAGANAGQNAAQAGANAGQNAAQAGANAGQAAANAGVNAGQNAASAAIGM